MQHLASNEEQRRNLRYDELSEFNLPDDFRVDTKHVAVLYVLDANKDGVFAYDDLMSFVMWTASNLPHDTTAQDFGEQVQARCVLQMWGAMRSHGSPDLLVDWLCQFLKRAYPSPTSPTPAMPPAALMPGALGNDLLSEACDSASDSVSASGELPVVQEAREVFGWSAIQTLYVLLNVADGYGIDLDSFCQVLCGDIAQLSAAHDPATWSGNSALDAGAATAVVGASAEHNAVRVHGTELRAFLMAFFTSYFAILERLGLDVLTEQRETAPDAVKAPDPIQLDQSLSMSGDHDV